MPCSFSSVLPRSPNRYGLVQKSSASAQGTGGAFVKRSAAYAPPLNRDDRAIPTPHMRAVVTDLCNIFLVLPASQALSVFCLTSPPKALEPGTRSHPSTRRFQPPRSGRESTRGWVIISKPTIFTLPALPAAFTAS